jgi:hypothetical protein
MAFNYSPKISREGLIFYLDAANKKSYSGTGSTWYDLSRNSNNGGLVNSPTYSTNNGGNFTFNGSNNIVNMGTINLQRNWSLEILTNMSSTSNIYGIFGQGTYATNQGLHILYDLNGNRGIVFGMYGNDNDYSTNYVPTINKWYHWIFTYNHTTFAKQFYADSILITPTSSTQNQYAGSGQFNIGGTYSNATHVANGKIAIAKMYDRVLSATESQQNYNALKSRFNLS